MNITASLKMVRQSVTQFIESIERGIRLFNIEQKTVGQVRTGVSIEKPDTILATLSFTPHSDPEEESIEISVNVKVESTIANIYIDLGWSDGEIIEIITRESFVYNSEDDLHVILNAQLKNTESVLISKMTKLIGEYRPPRYRLD